MTEVLRKAYIYASKIYVQITLSHINTIITVSVYGSHIFMAIFRIFRYNIVSVSMRKT